MEASNIPTKDSVTDREAEEAILGTILTNGRLIADADSLLVDDFYYPFLGEIFDSMQDLAKRSEPIDAITVGAEMEARGQWSKGHEKTELLTLIEKAGVGSNLPWYIKRVKDVANRRSAIVAARKALSVVERPDRPLEDSIAAAEKLLRDSLPINATNTGLMTLDTFVDRDLTQASWVMPPLLRREERLIITGFEGLGKTTLMRQMAVAAAAGMEPFSLRDAPPQRVLFVDCENPEEIMQSSFLQLREVLKRRHKSTEDRFLLKRHPGGLNVSNPRERSMLRSYCREAQPDLLVIGPAYKMYVGGAGAREEDLARSVVSTLDELREEFGFALILEHHAPHADAQAIQRGGQRDVRPIGSSLWLRWPEFGWGIRPKKGGNMAKREVEVSHWRGARGIRPWPTTMISGGEGSLPWVDPNRLRV